MAFPAVAATNTSVHTANVTSHTVNLASGTSPGDILMVAFVVDGNPTVTWPAGWNARAAQHNTAVRIEVRTRVADGTEGSTITITTSVAEQSVHRAWRITGCHATTGPEGLTATGATANPNPPVLDPANWATEDTLWFALCAYDNGSRTLTAYPASYTDTLNDRSTGTGGVGLGSGRRQNAVGSEDPGTFTISAADEWVAVTIGIRPAAASTVDLTVTLYETTTPVASWTLSNIAETAFTTAVRTLTLGEANSISNYANLRLGFKANGTGARVQISVANLETPGVPPNALVNPSAVSAVASVASPTLSTGVTPAPAVVAGVASVAAPAVAAGAVIAPSTVAAPASISTPAVTTGVQYRIMILAPIGA
jgi:hypothetical protein